MSKSGAGLTALKILKGLVWFVYMLASAAMIIIAFAFFLLLFDASTKSSFVEFIYNWGMFFAAPFVGMIEPTKLANGGVVSWAALFAIAAYAVVAWIIGGILNAISTSIYKKSRPQPAPAPVAAAPQPQAAPAPAPAAAAGRGTRTRGRGQRRLPAAEAAGPAAEAPEDAPQPRQARNGPAPTP